MKLVIDIDNEQVLFDIKNQGLEAETDTDKVIINALYNSTPLTERPKGRWIKEESILGWDGRSYQCSNCGRSIHLDTVMEDLSDYPYCHCGTEMSGGGEDEAND